MYATALIMCLYEQQLKFVR